MHATAPSCVRVTVSASLIRWQAPLPLLNYLRNHQSRRLVRSTFFNPPHAFFKHHVGKTQNETEQKTVKKKKLN